MRVSDLALIRDAVDMHIAGLRELGVTVPAPSTEATVLEVGAA